MTNNENLNVHNDGIENQRLAAKLLDWLTVGTERLRSSSWSTNSSLALTFLKQVLHVIPLHHTKLLNKVTSNKPRVKPQFTPIHKKQDSAKIFTTNSTEKSSVSCVFFKKAGHSLHKCHKSAEKPATERVKFIQSEKLCFGCLNSGHIAKNCSKRMIRNTCSKCHPTCLHEERQRQETKKEQPTE